MQLLLESYTGPVKVSRGKINSYLRNKTNSRYSTRNLFRASPIIRSLVPPGVQSHEESFPGISNKRIRRSARMARRPGKKRGIDIAVETATRKLQYGNEDFSNLVEDLAKGLDNVMNEISYGTNSSSKDACGNCEQVMMTRKRKYYVKPAYPCDDWDPQTRTCWLDRNVGDTVTFVLSLGKLGGRKPRVVWKQEFHVKDSRKRKDVVIDPEKPTWNVVIGSRGHEFRLSPITEMDIDFNRFSATIHNPDTPEPESVIISGRNKVFFQIRVIPTDLGFVYPGESITINIRSHVSLPLESMSFEWFLETDGEASTLPSNMHCSPTCGTLAITELRKEQEGILACSVYTNLKIFATKKRFLIKEVEKNSDVLLVSPQHHLHFAEAPMKRSSKNSIKVRQVSNTMSVFSDDNTYPEVEDEDLVTRQTPESENDDEDIDNLDENYGKAENLSPSFEESNFYGDENRAKETSQADVNEYSNAGKENFEAKDESKQNNYGGEETFQAKNDLKQNEAVENEEYNPKSSIALKENSEYDNYADDGFNSRTENRRRKGHSKKRLKQKGSRGQFSNLKKKRPRIYATEAEDTTTEVSPPKERATNHIPSERDILLQAETNEIIAADKVSRIIAVCYEDRQCSSFAACIINDLVGYCRCLPNYHGNGIWCWEDTNGRHARVGDLEVSARELSLSTETFH